MRKRIKPLITRVGSGNNTILYSEIDVQCCVSRETPLTVQQAQTFLYIDEICCLIKFTYGHTLDKRDFKWYVAFKGTPKPLNKFDQL